MLCPPSFLVNKFVACSNMWGATGRSGVAGATGEDYPMTKLAMTKIAVSDLDAQVRYYEAVTGFVVVNAFEAPGFAERIMRPRDSEDGAALVLMKTDGVDPGHGEAVTVFETADVDAFVERAVQAGGAILQAPQTLSAHGLRFAMIRDPEGHVIEALSWLG